MTDDAEHVFPSVVHHIYVNIFSEIFISFAYFCITISFFFIDLF